MTSRIETRDSRLTAERLRSLGVVDAARRLIQTPSDQPLLSADRLNDLRVAIWEYDRAEAETWDPRVDSGGRHADDPDFGKWR